MSIEPVLIFFALRQLRKNLREQDIRPEWQEYMKLAMMATAILFVLEFIVHWDIFFKWIWHLAVLALMVLVYRQKEFIRYRNLVIAVIPVLIIDLLRDFSYLFGSSISATINKYLDTADPFLFLWVVTMVIVYIRQQRTLDKEKKKRQEEEKQFQITAAQKAQLEVMVTERTAELRKQKETLEETLDNLKITQNQLVHSEKMASLGELTAGIAHEIQNPLNFVNNFSEVNEELIDELQTALDNNQPEEIRAIAKDIKANLAKITHHGKRADAIVKGMLQHSRASTGQLEDTDINQLAEEYLGLAYHGLRAKDKNFNATLRKNLDPSIGLIKLIPQDIGRVLLNLYNNAFYAVNEKKKQGLPGYEPTVTVSTRKLRNTVQLTVKDNGNGIPDKILDKIFQPFFTTKPTGQGTGLGLSLSYDIVTKGHGGTMTLNTEEGAFTEFIIELPL